MKNVEDIANVLPMKNTLQPKHYDYAPVTSDDDASLYSMYASEQIGRILNRGEDCSIKFSSDTSTVTIGTGDIVIKGRLHRLVEPIVYQLASFGALANRTLVLVVDLSKENAYSGSLGKGDYRFINNQSYFALLNVGEKPIQEDILNGGKVFMLPIITWNAEGTPKDVLPSVETTLEYMVDKLPELVTTGLPDAVREVASDIIIEIANPVISERVVEITNEKAPELLEAIMPDVVDTHIDRVLPDMLPLPVGNILTPMLEALVPLVLMGSMNSSVMNALYPIGSIYQTVDPEFDPNVSFAGNWKLIRDAYSTPKDSLVIGAAGSASVAGTVIGSIATDSHALSVGQMPAHAHGVINKQSNVYVMTMRNPSGTAGRTFMKPVANSGSSRAVFAGRPGAGNGDGSDLLFRSIPDLTGIQSTGSNSGHSHGMTPRQLLLMIWVRVKDTPRKIKITGGVLIGSGSDFNVGSVVSVEAVVPEGKVFSQWKISEGAYMYDLASEKTSFIMPDSDVTITAEFEDKVYEPVDVTIIKGSGSGAYTPGTIVTISATEPETSGTFSKWVLPVDTDTTIENIFNASTKITVGHEPVSIEAVYTLGNEVVMTVVGPTGYKKKQLVIPGEVVDSINLRELDPDGENFDGPRHKNREILEMTCIKKGVIVEDLGHGDYKMIYPDEDFTINFEWEWIDPLMMVFKDAADTNIAFKISDKANGGKPFKIFYSGGSIGEHLVVPGVDKDVMDSSRFGDLEVTFRSVDNATTLFNIAGIKLHETCRKHLSGVHGLISHLGADFDNTTGDYADMFSGCSELVYGPDFQWAGDSLPILTRMFYKCTALKRIKFALTMTMPHPFESPRVEMLFAQSGLTEIPRLNMSGQYMTVSMFDGCYNLDYSTTPNSIYNKYVKFPERAIEVHSFIDFMGATNYQITEEDMDRGYAIMFFKDEYTF